MGGPLCLSLVYLLPPYMSLLYISLHSFTGQGATRQCRGENDALGCPILGDEASQYRTQLPHTLRKVHRPPEQARLYIHGGGGDFQEHQGKIWPPYSQQPQPLHTPKSATLFPLTPQRGGFYCYGGREDFEEVKDKVASHPLPQ